MRLITMYKNLGEAKLEFYGCPIGCRYCAHRLREKREVTSDQLLKFVADYETKKVFFGGAEPALFKKDLVNIIRTLHKKGKEITLKTTGYDLDFVKATIGSVHRYIVEVKAPLDDVEGTMHLTSMDEEKTRQYLASLKASLEAMRGQKVRTTTRVIPTVIDRAKTERLGQQLQGLVTEAQLIQFMSGTNDLPFDGIDRPAPPIAEMEALGNILLKYIPTVIVQGDGLDMTLKE